MQTGGYLKGFKGQADSANIIIITDEWSLWLQAEETE